MLKGSTLRDVPPNGTRSKECITKRSYTEWHYIKRGSNEWHQIKSYFALRATALRVISQFYLADSPDPKRSTHHRHSHASRHGHLRACCHVHGHGAIGRWGSRGGEHIKQVIRAARGSHVSC